ncbi:HlyD family secretion protein [Pseudomonas sp. JQ170]|uniref:HlyD family secretion protein n=1 Tax=unclassified Pseudomonas TaxID=196821 RepID=UPI002650DE4F|nr:MULTISPECIES: HlyD family secretion protein [unclassified Pseudomonas]MDN7143401.1 HlyD family secretion protein [Pseudomonas sp. JQ170]WRO78486.1 HlyD family secretion protein [Pseudomonas sp. 170C]
MNAAPDSVDSAPRAQVAPAPPRPGKRKAVGLLLCASALAVLVGGWVMGFASSSLSTDNAYVRGDVTSLAAKVAGYVTTVDVRDNQAVRAGEVLFRIDDKDYRAHLAQAEANVSAAQARLSHIDAQTRLQHALIRQAQAQHRSAAADMSLASKTHDRSRKLIVSHAVSQALVDETGAARSKAVASVSATSASVDAQQQTVAVLMAQRDAAVAAVMQAQAARELARIDLDSTVVRAPVDGVVGNRQVRVGRYVTTGAALLDIVPVHEVWVVANFKETQLEQLQPGQRVRITVDGFPDDRLEGVVDSFAPGSGSAFSLLPTDNATGNFVRVVQRVPVKITLANNPLPGRIVPGLSARVEVALGGGS